MRSDSRSQDRILDVRLEEYDTRVKVEQAAADISRDLSQASRGENLYDAFISYSHAVDGKLAPALQWVRGFKMPVRCVAAAVALD